jgi:hypothetical protein
MPNNNDAAQRWQTRSGAQQSNGQQQPQFTTEDGKAQGYFLGSVWITPGRWLADSHAWAVSLDAMLRAYLGGVDVVLLVNPQTLTVYAAPVRRILQQGWIIDDKSGQVISLSVSAWENRGFLGPGEVHRG